MRAEEGEVKTTVRTESGSLSREVHLRRGRATTVFLLAVGVLLAWLCFRLARPFLPSIAWATIFAVVFAPVHRRARGFLRSENLSAAVSTFVTMLVGVLPLVWLGSVIAREARLGYQFVRAHLSNGASLSDFIGQIQWLGPAWARVQALLEQWDVDINGLGTQAAQYLGEFALELARGTIANLSSFLLNLILIAFTLFFFFRDGQLILARLQRLLPIEAAASVGVYELIGQVIRAAIYGVVAIALLKGVLAGLAFWVLGVPSPVLWGAVGAIASVIPVFGISLVWVPAALVLWFQGHVFKALLLVIWGATVLSLIDNFLYPILVRNQVRLHTLVVFISTLGGLGVFGLLGFVIGPIVATLTLTLIEVASDYYAQRREKTAETAE